MKLDFDQLIQIVAERHKFILSKDDPLLAAVSLNEVVFDIHSQALIEKMDEQNARMVAGLQATLNASRSETKNEREKFMHAVNAIHQKHIGDHRKLLEDHLNATANYASEIGRSKQTSWIVMLVTIGIAIATICANLFISTSK